MKIKRWIVLIKNTRNFGYLLGVDGDYYDKPNVTQDIDQARGFFSFDHAESVAHKMWLASAGLEYDIKEVDRDPGDGIANQAIMEYFDSMAKAANADYIHIAYRPNAKRRGDRYTVTLVDKDLFQLARGASTPHGAYNKIVADYKKGLAHT